jgi:cytochrome c-type biogenesis protein
VALLLLSFLAGVITVTAPCIVTLLPVIVGGSIVRTGQEEESRWRRLLIITGSLALSIILFTLLLRGTTALLGVPQTVWQTIAGVIVTIFGVSLVFPALWDRIVIATGLERRTGTTLAASAQQKGAWGDVLLGAALGPVFNSCSPTYALVVAAILPISFVQGVGHIVAYAAGLSLALLVLALAGQSLIGKLGWLRDPHGWFRQGMGLLLIVVGLGIIFGLDRNFQTFILDSGLYNPILEFESRLNL